MRYITNFFLTLLFLMVFYLFLFSSRAFAVDCESGDPINGVCPSACETLANLGVTRYLTWSGYIYGDNVQQACFGSASNACLMDGFGSELCLNTSDGKITPGTTCSRKFRHIPQSCPRGGSFLGGDIPSDELEPIPEDERIFPSTNQRTDDKVVEHVGEHLPNAFDALDSQLERNMKMIVATQNLIGASDNNIRSELLTDRLTLKSTSNKVDTVIELVKDLDNDLAESTALIVASGAANTLQLSEQIASSSSAVQETQNDMFGHVFGIVGRLSGQERKLRELASDNDTILEEVKRNNRDLDSLDDDVISLSDDIYENYLISEEIQTTLNTLSSDGFSVDLSPLDSKLDGLASGLGFMQQMTSEVARMTDGVSNQITALEGKFDSAVEEITNPSQSFNSPTEKPFVGGVFSDEIVNIKKEIKDLETQVLEKMSKPLIGMGEMNFNTGTYSEEAFVITRGGQDISVGFNLFDTLGENVTLIKAVILLVASLIAMTIIMTSGRRS